MYLKSHFPLNIRLDEDFEFIPSRKQPAHICKIEFRSILILLLHTLSYHVLQGLCDVTPEGYCQMTNMLMGLAGGNVVIILEVCMT